MKNILQSIWDFIGIPFRLVLFDQEWLPRFGWTTLEEDRMAQVLPRVKGRLLDIGAGPNTLVNTHGDGVGVDVFDWGGGTQVVEDTSKLPFKDMSFDTVTFVACLNHIPYRKEAVLEAARVMRPDGRIIVTMINPILGDIGHAIWWYSEDKHRGGMEEGEVGGMWSSEIVRLMDNAGLKLREHKTFVYGMNHIYVFERFK
ncbi:MAG: class I SAM-dependent methyltransferase [Desulfovibrio sp.]